MAALPIQLPGLHWDSTKNRYFRLPVKSGRNHLSIHDLSIHAATTTAASLADNCSTLAQKRRQYDKTDPLINDY